MRPFPPEFETASNFAPAIGMTEWVLENLLMEDGEIHNPDHLHLIGADIEYLWASTGFEKQGLLVLGQCEQVMFRVSGWARWKAEEQLQAWFKRIDPPKFLITLAADYCRTCSDLEFCMLIEHELYHVGQEMEFGAPKFNKEGSPSLKLRGHDSEEFVGVVRRYGVGSPLGGTARLVHAASQAPTVGRASLARSCGTCLRAVA